MKIEHIDKTFFVQDVKLKLKLNDLVSNDVHDIIYDPVNDVTNPIWDFTWDAMLDYEN